MKKSTTFLTFLFCLSVVFGQITPIKNEKTAPSVSNDLDTYFKPMRWRNIGPFRGGRAVTISGVVNNTLVYYAGMTGGGVWKTEDGGLLSCMRPL